MTRIDEDKALQVRDMKRRAKENGVVLEIDNMHAELARRFNYPLFGLMRQLNKGNPADALEQDDMGVVSESVIE